MSPGIVSTFRRRSRICLLLLTIGILVLPSQASAATGALVYSTDFSTDPGWSTNNPATNYYDPGKGMFHYLMRDGSGAYVNVQVPYHGESFTLSFDILPARTDYQASVKFGLGDNDQVSNQRLTIFTEFSNGPYGRLIWIRSIDGQNQRREASSYYLSYGGSTVRFFDGIWYHAVMDYRLEARTLSLSVYRRNDSLPLWHYTLGDLSVFPTMNRIYMSKIGESANPNAIAEGYIDNVAFSIVTAPEASPPSESQAPPATTTAGTPAVPPVQTVGSPGQPATPAQPIPLLTPSALAALALSVILAGTGWAGRK